MNAIVVQMTPKIVQELDESAEAGYYPNRNELVRMSVRDLLLNHKELKFSTRMHCMHAKEKALDKDCASILDKDVRKC